MDREGSCSCRAVVKSVIEVNIGPGYSKNNKKNKKKTYIVVLAVGDVSETPSSSAHRFSWKEERETLTICVQLQLLH